MSGRVYQYPTGGIFGGRTELPEVMGTGIEFVPNFTGVFGRVLRAVPSLTEEIGKVFTEKMPWVCFGTYPAEQTLVIIVYAHWPKRY